MKFLEVLDKQRAAEPRAKVKKKWIWRLSLGRLTIRWKFRNV